MNEAIERPHHHPEKSTLRARSGFTLIEIIVYAAVLAIVSTIAVTTLIRIQASLAQIRVTRTLAATEAVAMERMVRVIRDAASVNLGASILNSSPGVLSLIGAETPALTHRFSLANGMLTYDVNGADAVSLTPPGVVVTNLVFRAINAFATSSALKVELTVTASSGRATTTHNIYSTVVLRNAYVQ